MSTIPSTRRNVFFACLMFCLFLIVGYISDLILIRYPGWMIADDVLMALAAGIIVFFYERERSRLLSEKVRVVREMNSFVRNELQILYASTEHLDKVRVSTIESSVERIDWALRELLPGSQQLPAPVKVIGGRKGDAERSA